MISAIQNYCTSTCVSIVEATNRAVDALNRTIQRVREYRLGLIVCSLGMAYLHDYNAVLLYGIIGGVCYKSINKIDKSINALYHACFIVFEPLLEYKIYNQRVLYYPLKALSIVTGVLSYFYFMPITLFLTEGYIALSCGADLVSSSRRLVKKYTNNS
jgi:hypothetical protein